MLGGGQSCYVCGYSPLGKLGGACWKLESQIIQNSFRGGSLADVPELAKSMICLRWPLPERRPRTPQAAR